MIAAPRSGGTAGPRHDVIVVGIGGMGSAALYHLASRGAVALGLEQFRILHELGSSHGESRIFRLAYAEHPDYVPLARRARALWRRLERETGERLLETTGGLDAGPPDGATVAGSLRSCVEHDLPHELLDAAALRRRFPGLRLPDGMAGVHQPDAGFLLPELCIALHVAAARKLGAVVREGERVTGWEERAGGVAVRTEAGVHQARSLVLSAGAWTGGLVPSLREAAVPERQVVIWTRPLRPERFEARRFPVVNLQAPEGRFYACPIHRIPGVKFGRYHHCEERVDAPDLTDREVHAVDEEVVRVGIRRYFPDAAGPTVAATTCLFTNSPDEHFIVDLLPGSRRVVVAAGFSGHGFKFSSVVGEILADLALEGGTSSDVELFRIDRLPQAPGRSPGR